MLLDGMTNGQIGEELNVRPDVVSQWKSDPLFRARLAEERDLWEADLRFEKLAGKRTRLRFLSDEIDELQKQRSELATDLGEHVTVSKAITANVVAAGKEMQNVRLGGAGHRQQPTAPTAGQPPDQEFTRDLAVWLRRMAIYMEWSPTITLEEVCGHLRDAS